MSVKFNIVERGNPSNCEAPKKFYPSIQSSGRVTTREMAEMAAQRSTLSTMDMMAAIESFMAIIPEQLTKGNTVELGARCPCSLLHSRPPLPRTQSGRY